MELHRLSMVLVPGVCDGADSVARSRMLCGGDRARAQRILTSQGKFCSVAFVRATNHHVRETSPVKCIIFPSYTHLIYYV